MTWALGYNHQRAWHVVEPASLPRDHGRLMRCGAVFPPREVQDARPVLGAFCPDCIAHIVLDLVDAAATHELALDRVAGLLGRAE